MKPYSFHGWNKIIMNGVLRLLVVWRKLHPRLYWFIWKPNTFQKHVLCWIFTFDIKVVVHSYYFWSNPFSTCKLRGLKNHVRFWYAVCSVQNNKCTEVDTNNCLSVINNFFFSSIKIWLCVTCFKVVSYWQQVKSHRFHIITHRLLLYRHFLTLGAIQ